MAKVEIVQLENGSYAVRKTTRVLWFKSEVFIDKDKRTHSDYSWYTWGSAGDVLRFCSVNTYEHACRLLKAYNEYVFKDGATTKATVITDRMCGNQPSTDDTIPTPPGAE